MREKMQSITTSIKLNEKSEGTMTIEASFTLLIFWFFILLFSNFGFFFLAQNYVAHGLLETAKTMAFDSLDAEHFSYTESLFDFFTDNQIMQDEKDTFQSDKESYVGWIQNLKKQQFDSVTAEQAAAGYTSTGESVAKSLFGYCAGTDPTSTDANLREYKVVDGLDGLKFTISKADGDLNISVEYQVQMVYGFLLVDPSMNKITLHQNVKCALWSK